MRKPNEDELQELKEYLMDRGQDEETADLIVKTHWFSVIDNYISDCPAYVGKLMMAVYGCPEFYEVFIWIDNKIERVELDSGFKELKKKTIQVEVWRGCVTDVKGLPDNWAYEIKDRDVKNEN